MARTGGPGRSDVARCWAGFASLGAGLVHLAVVQEHLDEWWLYGVFFAVLGAAQLLWAMAALARDEAPFPRTVALANVAVVLLWLVTRTTGLPVGPEPWEAEAFGRADVLATVLELVVVALLVALPRLAATEQPVPAGRGSRRFVALLFAGALAVAAVTTPALAATSPGGRAPAHGE